MSASVCLSVCLCLLCTIVPNFVETDDRPTVVVVTFFNHNFFNCNATLILAIKIYEIKYNISLNDIHT